MNDDFIDVTTNNDRLIFMNKKRREKRNSIVRGNTRKRRVSVCEWMYTMGVLVY